MHDLSQNRTSNYIFNFDKMLALQEHCTLCCMRICEELKFISPAIESFFEQLGESARDYAASKKLSWCSKAFITVK
jgi:arginyl-tRNA synthetase